MSPHPLSVYTSVGLISIPPQALLWAQGYFHSCLIFPNILHYSIPQFFRPLWEALDLFFLGGKCVHASLIIPFLSCHFIYLCLHSIFHMRRAAFLMVGKNWTSESNALILLPWLVNQVDELQCATHPKIQLHHQLVDENSTSQNCCNKKRYDVGGSSQQQTSGKGSIYSNQLHH